MRINDAVTAFPSILLALVFISLLGFGKYNVILALGVAFVPSYARVIRSEFARHREMNYVKKRPAWRERGTCALCFCIFCPIPGRCFCLPWSLGLTTPCWRRPA